MLDYEPILLRRVNKPDSATDLGPEKRFDKTKAPSQKLPKVNPYSKKTASLGSGPNKRNKSANKTTHR